MTPSGMVAPAGPSSLGLAPGPAMLGVLDFTKVSQIQFVSLSFCSPLEIGLVIFFIVTEALFRQGVDSLFPSNRCSAPMVQSWMEQILRQVIRRMAFTTDLVLQPLRRLSEGVPKA